MRLKFDDFNEGEIARIRLGIRQNNEQRSKLIEGLFNKDKPINIVIPHKTYHVSIEQLLLSKNTFSFEYIGKQYLIVNAQKVIGLAALTETSGGDYSLKLNFAEQASSYKDLFIFLDKIEREEEYYFAIIKIPALYLTAAWLKNKHENIFVPFHSRLQEFQSYQIYSESEFIRRISNMVVKIK